MDGWTHGSTSRKIDAVVEIISIIIMREGATQTGPRDEESKAVLPGKFQTNFNNGQERNTAMDNSRSQKTIQILQLLHLEELNMMQFRACCALSFQKLLGRSK